MLVTSARDGSGVVDLQHRISVAVAGRTAAVQRLDGDVRSVGRPAAGGGRRHRADGWTRAPTPSWSTRSPAPRACPWCWTPSSGTTAARRARAPAGRSPGGSRRCARIRCGACACDTARAATEQARRRRHHGVGRPCGAGAFVVAAGDARSAVRGRAGHPRRSATGSGERCRSGGPTVGGRRGDPARRRPRRRPGPGGDAARRCGRGNRCGGPSFNALQWLLALSAVAGPGLAGGAGRDGLAAAARAWRRRGWASCRCPP